MSSHAGVRERAHEPPQGVENHRSAARVAVRVSPARPLVPRPVASLVALLPAHDEEASLPAALASLAGQTRPPDHVIVVADNCTDRTEEVARAAGAEVFSTVGNTAKKAGALNQVLAELLPQLADNDLVLVMDADSLLDADFLETARGKLDGSSPLHERHVRQLGGVGGTFRGGPGGGLLGTFQRNEYARYARDVRRLKGKALVLTGTASVFRARVLREVQAGPDVGRPAGQVGGRRRLRHPRAHRGQRALLGPDAPGLRRSSPRSGAPSRPR